MRYNFSVLNTLPIRDKKASQWRSSQQKGLFRENNARNWPKFQKKEAYIGTNPGFSSKLPISIDKTPL